MADAPRPYDIGPLTASWIRSLRARNLSANTQRIYARAVGELRTFLLNYEPDPDLPGARPAPPHSTAPAASTANTSRPTSTA